MSEVVEFSVVIPLYNKKNKIEKTLDSIRFQTCKTFEVIIVNDGSSDGSEEVAKRWIKQNTSDNKAQYRLITQNNSGVSIARNHGIKVAKNDYVALLDADDLWKKNHLETLTLLVERFSKDVDLFSTAVAQFQNNKTYNPNLASYEKFTGIVDFFKVSLISNGFINSSSVCINKKRIHGNLFPEQMKNYEDVITWAKLSGNKGFGFCSERSSVYVIDNAEAAFNVDFNSYSKFDEILKSVDYDKKAMYRIKFFLLHLLFCRLNLSVRDYMQAGKDIRRQVNVLSFLFFMVAFVPRFVLKYLRNVRKQSVD